MSLPAGTGHGGTLQNSSAAKQPRCWPWEPGSRRPALPRQPLPPLPDPPRPSSAVLSPFPDCKWNHAKCDLSDLAFVAQHNSLAAHPSSCVSRWPIAGAFGVPSSSAAGLRRGAPNRSPAEDPGLPRFCLLWINLECAFTYAFL